MEKQVMSSNEIEVQPLYYLSPNNVCHFAMEET